jgi:hypothetical protein
MVGVHQEGARHLNADVEAGRYSCSKIWQYEGMCIMSSNHGSSRRGRGVEVRPSSRYKLVCQGQVYAGWLGIGALTISSYSGGRHGLLVHADI